MDIQLAQRHNLYDRGVGNKNEKTPTVEQLHARFLPNFAGRR